MKNLFRRVGTAAIAFGFDPRRMFSSLCFFLGYFVDLIRWVRLSKNHTSGIPLRLLPILSDKYLSSGVARGHYFHQDLWAADSVYRRSPTRHVDVGSRIDGFVSHLLVFREVEVVDIRPLRSNIKGLIFIQADLMADELPGLLPSDSVSCLHALEHFGLGRYGDPIRPDGWKVGLRNLASLVNHGGFLYLSVPIGEPAVEFNAQRIFDPAQIVDEARQHGLELQEFCYIDDDGEFHNDPGDAYARLRSCGALKYGCGCFLLSKRKH